MTSASGTQRVRVIAGSWSRVGVLVAASLALTACPNGKGDTTPTRTVRVRVKSYTEPAPVRLIAAARPYAFTVSSSGLDRWDLRTGARLHLSGDHGLPGDRVSEVVHDQDRESVWIATDGGITRYDLESGTFAALPSPPQVLGLEELADVSLSPSGDGGLWIGHGKGLFYASPEGAWAPTPVTVGVTALMRDSTGRLWIGTERGLIARQPEGETYEYDQEQGCDLARVRFIAEAPDRSPLIVGENSADQQRIVIIRDDACATFRASPDIEWLAAAQRPGETIILTPRRLFTMQPNVSRARRLTRDGMKLAPVKVGPDGTKHESGVKLDPLEIRVPSGATAIGAAGDEILIGTRDLGVARIHRKQRGTRWLRRGELVADARTLSVACRTPKDCYLATGASTAWRFDGRRFQPFTSEGDERVLAFVRGPDGQVYGVRESEDLQRLLVSPIKDGIWVRVSEIAIETPGGRPGLSFARFSPSGVLWMGLRYLDEAGEERPYGAALIDVTLGAVVYHHASRDTTEVEQGVLPIPINVQDACFHADDETWLATSEGAARIRGHAVKLFTEDDGLASEILRGIACSAGGMVWVASGRGVGGWNGESWDYPAALGFSVNDIEIGKDNRLWMGTDRGLAVYDGARVRRLDVRRGLLQNQVDDVSLDHLGRVWVRGAEGITVVLP